MKITICKSDLIHLCCRLKKYKSLESQGISNEWYKCDPCKTSFANETKWARHMQRHKGEPGKSRTMLLQGVQKLVDILTPLFSLAWVSRSGSYSTC